MRQPETLQYLEQCYRDTQKKWLKCWGGVNLGHLMGGRSASFINRHQIVSKEVCGAAGDACEETVVEWFDRHQVTCLKRNLLVTEEKKILSLAVAL